MTDRIVLKRYDTYPRHVVTLRDSPSPGAAADGLPGEPIDLEGTEVIFVVYAPGEGPIAINCTPAPEGAKGEVPLAWRSEFDVLPAGIYDCDFRIRRGRPPTDQAVPSESFLTLEIIEPSAARANSQSSR